MNLQFASTNSFILSSLNKVTCVMFSVKYMRMAVDEIVVQKPYLVDIDLNIIFIHLIISI